MDTIQLDFEQARAKHLLFKSRLRAILYGIDIDEAPVLSHHECNVGKWIYGHALNAYGHIPEMHEFEKIHADIHTSAKKLVALYREGKVEEARTGLSEMELVADKLVAMLHNLEKKLKDEGAASVDESGHLSIKLEEFKDILKSNIELDNRIKEQVRLVEEVNARYEKKAKEAEAAHKVLYDFFMQMPALMAILRGPEHIFELANPDYLQFVGRKVIGRTVREAFPEVEGQGFFELLDEVYRTGNPFIAKEMPAQIDRGKGLELCYFDLMYQAFRGEDDKVQGILVFAYDVTEQVGSRRASEESEKKARFITEAMPQKVWTADAKGNVNYYNNHWLEYTGLPLESLLNWGWKDIVHPEDLQRSMDTWMNALSTGESFELEHRFRGKNGEYRWHLSRGVSQRDSSGNIVMWIGTNTDIHDQKLTLEKLRANEERLALAIDSTDLGTWDYYPKTGEITWSETMKQLFGLQSDKKITYDLYLEAIHPADKGAMDSLVQAAMTDSSLQGQFTAEYRVIGIDDHKERWIYAKGKVAFDDEGQAVRFTGTALDITENKTSEEAINRMQQQLKDALDVGMVSTFSWDVQNNRMYTDEKLAFTFGIDPKKASEGMPLEPFINSIYNEDRPKVESLVAQALQTGDYEAEYRVKGADGLLRWVIARGKVKFDQDGKPTIFSGILVDINERKEMEEKVKLAYEDIESKVTFRNLELERQNRELKAQVEELQQKLGSIAPSV